MTLKVHRNHKAYSRRVVAVVVVEVVIVVFVFLFFVVVVMASTSWVKVSSFKT